MYWTPNAQIVSKASIACYVCLGVLLASSAVLLLEGCRGRTEGEAAMKNTTATTTETTTQTTTTTSERRTMIATGSTQPLFVIITPSTTTTSTTTTLRIRATNGVRNTNRKIKGSMTIIAKAGEMFNTSAEQFNATAEANTSDIWQQGPAVTSRDTEGTLNKRTIKYVIIAAIAILCFCGMLVLCWCCCSRGIISKRLERNRERTQEKNDEASQMLQQRIQAESDEASQMLHENGSGYFENYDGQHQVDPESGYPYEYEFTRVAIDSMIPERNIIVEDEPDLS